MRSRYALDTPQNSNARRLKVTMDCRTEFQGLLQTSKRSCSKTVACVQMLFKGALESTKPDPRFAYVGPLYGHANADSLHHKGRRFALWPVYQVATQQHLWLPKPKRLVALDFDTSARVRARNLPEARTNVA
jgi:hypothetical protein